MGAYHESMERLRKQALEAPGPKITKCLIGPYPRPLPKGMFDPMPKVTVQYDDGTAEVLFSFYPDELSFAESEFVGKTRAQALELRHQRDVAYLQS